jgi:Invasin, domain 3/Bacterial Ig-like domain (group 1)
MNSSIDKLHPMKVGSLFGIVAPLIALISLGCGDGELVLPAGEAVRIEAAHGNGQSAPAGQKLPDSLVVRLVDQDGNGVPNGTITWSVSNGGGSIAPPTATTDENGLAWAWWILGQTAGPNTANATAANVGSVTFAATGQSDDGGAGNGGGGGNGGDDGTGGGGSGTGSGGSGTGGGGSGTGGGGTGTGGGGSGTGGGGSGTGGGGTGTGGGGTGTGGGGTGGGGGGGGTAVVPSASLSTISATPKAIVAGGTTTITVVVRNAAGERIPGASVRFEATGAGNIITQPSAPTNVDGVATGALRATQAGTRQISAVINGSVPVQQTVQVEVSGPVHHLAFLVPPHNVREEEPFTVKVALMDAQGNIAPLSGIEIYVDLFRAGRDHPDNQRVLGDRFRDTENGVAVFDLRVINGNGNGATGTSETGYRLRALTDELPELGPHGPTPWLFSRPFDVLR